LKIQTILGSIDLGDIALPEFQRGYVWKRNLVSSFAHFSYRCINNMERMEKRKQI